MIPAKTEEIAFLEKHFGMDADGLFPSKKRKLKKRDAQGDRQMTDDIEFIRKMFREYMKLEDRYLESEVEE